MVDHRKGDSPLVEVSGINLRGWEKPVEKLVDCLRAATGTLFEPYAIQRKAKAEAEAAITTAETQIHIMDLAQRAEHRRTELENRRQKNIESIATQASKELANTVSKTPVDEDWTLRFVSHAQDVSDVDMQRLWSRILAGEVTEPGSFSLRCMRVVADLQKDEAELFTRLCFFIWEPENTGAVPVVIDFLSPAVSSQVGRYGDFLRLEHAGLIKISDFPLRMAFDPQRTTIRYFDRVFELNAIPNGGNLGSAA